MTPGTLCNQSVVARTNRLTMRLGRAQTQRLAQAQLAQLPLQRHLGLERQWMMCIMPLLR